MAAPLTPCLPRRNTKLFGSPFFAGSVDTAWCVFFFFCRSSRREGRVSRRMRIHMQPCMYEHPPTLMSFGWRETYSTHDVTHSRTLGFAMAAQGVSVGRLQCDGRLLTTARPRRKLWLKFSTVPVSYKLETNACKGSWPSGRQCRWSRPSAQNDEVLNPRTWSLVSPPDMLTHRHMPSIARARHSAASLVPATAAHSAHSGALRMHSARVSGGSTAVKPVS